MRSTTTGPTVPTTGSSDSGVADQYDPLVAALPAVTNDLDLNRVFGDRVRANGYIAWGHYAAASAALLGQTIGARINQIQLSSQSQNSDHIDGSRATTGK